ncbi:HAMP domain-containing sensor histidine kinase [Sphingopyxis sp. 2PD]|uniref:sensor histidine kinase n=1 Tax=Sphingopyxis sp. 2PD TaxID=2502196 RepID=UPI001BB2BE81|nr:HAMP domain-containing sensor histidine kinase [Sphingopyxis sp. 2PD]
MNRRRHSLRARVVLTIVGGVLLTSIIFGLTAFAIAYSVEDDLFQNALADEVAHQKSSWARTGMVAAAKNSDVAIYRRVEMLPLDIRNEVAQNPKQTEFYGCEGRHYHIQKFDLNGSRSGASAASAFAVIEVSQDLLVRPFRDSLIKLLVWMSLLITISVAGFAWWLVDRTMKPLSDLALDVAKAEPDVPMIDASNYPANEIGSLAEALEQAFGRIRGFIDREQAFTRDASHELRTPLAVVLGAAEVIALKRDLPLHLVEPLRRIETATTDMTLALDQLLALARENKGVVRGRVALRPMIDKAVAWAKVRYSDSLIAVSNKVDSGAAAFVHPTSLQLVLNNLIGNCFQHVGSGQLVIDFDERALSISDDGPGFETSENPFVPFAKGNASSGSGLGLDISRRLCDAAGIGLTVGETKGGRGTSFRLAFSSDLHR